MTPTIRKTYLARSRSGRIVSTFDSPALLRAFIAKQAERNVKLEAWEQTTTCKPLVEHRAIAEAKAPLKVVR